MRVLAFLLLLASFAAAVVDVDPKTVGGASVVAGLTWAVDAGGGSASELSLKTYSFYSDSRQSFEVVSADSHSTGVDANGNSLLVFSLNAGLQATEVSYSAVVRTRQSLELASASNEAAYLGESELVKFSAGISGKAAELASSSELESAVSFSEWVHNNVHYEGAGYGSTSLDSATVFELREGTCDEFSHLLIALLRSQGIPAKFVAGFVYSGEEWVAHAWVEAAVGGKWVPLDPTFNEAIVLDGTHLKFAEGKDQSEIREEISGRGAGLDLSRASVVRRSSLSFSSITPFEHLFSLSVSGPSQQLGEGSLAVVSARVSNTALQPLAAPLSIIVPKQVRIVSEKDALLFLAPGESKEFNWTLVLPNQLAEGYDYTFPVVVETLGAQAQFNVSARRGGAVAALSSLQLSDVSFSADASTLRFFVKTKNTGSNAFREVNAIVSFQGIERTNSFSLEPGEEKTLEFAFPVLGAGSFSGTIILVAGELRLSQPFTAVIQSTPAPSSAPLQPPASGERDLFLFAAMAMVLIIALFILLLKKKKAYFEA